MVSCLPTRDGGLDLSCLRGGYVERQSASAMGPRPGEGGRTVVEKVRGEAGRGLPLDDGRDDGGESRSRPGSFGDGTRCRGELGRDGVRELLKNSVSTGIGLDLRLLLFNEDDEDCGDWAFE